MNNNPFNEQHQNFSDAHHQQQHQRINFGLENSKVQLQTEDDAFGLWSSPSADSTSALTAGRSHVGSNLNVLPQQSSQGYNPKNQPLVTSSSMSSSRSHSNVAMTHDHSIPLPSSQQYQFSGGPHLSSTTSFDPFSAPPSTSGIVTVVPTASVVAPIHATQYQLVPSTQHASTVAWSADPYNHPSQNTSSQPSIMQQYYSQQTPNNNPNQQHGPIYANFLPQQQNLQNQEQQLVPTDWYAKENVTITNQTRNDFIGQNYTANASIPLPPTIRRSTTPTISTTSQRYNNYTLESSPSQNNHSYDAVNYSTAPAAAATTTTALITAPSASASNPPSPPRDVNERQLQMSQIIAQKQRLPPDSSPLPNPDEIVSSGHVLSRISFRTIVLKRWKQTYWVQYGPHTLLLFRSLADYQDWLTNPYHTAKMRDYLIKLKIDFCKDLLEPGVMGYQITQANRKGYERGEPIMWHFKLERWMDYGATIAAAFASPDEEEIKSIRAACATCIRNSKSGRSSISARMRAYARTAAPLVTNNSIPANSNAYGTDDGLSNNNYLSTSSRAPGHVEGYR